MVVLRDAAELQRRANRLRLVLSDVDGVWTDGGVYYSESGEVMKRFSVRDGMGVERLRLRGIETGIMTREMSPCVRARADKLGLSHVYLGIRDKRATLPAVLSSTGLGADQVAYIGDDVNDLDVLLAVADAGLTGAPADAVPAVRRVVHYTTSATGGAGAFREFAEWLLSLKFAEE